MLRDARERPAEVGALVVRKLQRCIWEFKVCSLAAWWRYSSVPEG
jgi:hypothetical protein